MPKNTNKYQLLDCGDKLKLEQFGNYRLIRPCPQAIWPKTAPSMWIDVDAEFVRTGEEKGDWKWKLPLDRIPQNWVVESDNGLKWHIEPNQFGNVGVFVEHWEYATSLATEFAPSGKVLNLFTYSGSNAVYLVKKGFKMTAVDSSRSAMTTYAKNLDLNKLEREGQRMILEDCSKFVLREIRREAKYDAVMIDAPSYGKGTKKEVFNIEDNLIELLQNAARLINSDGKIVLTLHSPRFTPAILKIMCSQMFPLKNVTVEEIMPRCQSDVLLPSGFLVKIY